MAGECKALIHHQNATCGVSCGSIPLRRMPNTTPGAVAPIFEIGLPCIWHRLMPMK